MLEHWSGYRGSTPVRIGNGAAEQLQLDIYGEALDALFSAERAGSALPYQGWQAISGILDWLALGDAGLQHRRHGDHPRVSPVWLFVGIGAVFLVWFFLHVRARERGGGDPLVSVGLFRNATSNLGLLTLTLQRLILQGVAFVISVYLQQARGYSAIETGVILVPATVGILLSSAAATRMAKRHAQRRLIRAGFFVTTLGLVLLLAPSWQHCRGRQMISSEPTSLRR